MLLKTLNGLYIPEDNDTIFIGPEITEWPRLSAANHGILKNLASRKQCQAELLEAACSYTQRILPVSRPREPKASVVAVGHQPGWHHCGIWSKQVAVSNFARSIGGTALHLIVDHDACDTAMLLPDRTRGGLWRLEQVNITTKQKNVAPEVRRPALRIEKKAFIEKVTSDSRSRFCRHVWSGLDMSVQENENRFDNISDTITYLQALLNHALGLHILYLPVSQLCKSEAFERFFISIVMGAARFAGSYNRALATKVGHGNKNKRQAPAALELNEQTGRVELPFWLLAENGERARLYAAQRTDGCVQIGTGKSELGSLNSNGADGHKARLTDILGPLRYRLRPKAVSLTLFARLFLADWFVHGLGGAGYEHITDHLIADYYGIKDLTFGIVTANLNLHLPDESCSSPQSAHQLRNELRHLKYNPEKFVPADLREKEPAKSMIAEKLRLVSNTKDRSIPARLRRSAWRSITEINEKLLNLAGSRRAQLEKRLAAAERLEKSTQIANHRGYFFGLFPETKLRQIVDTLNFTEHAAVGGLQHCHENNESYDSCPTSG